MLNRIFQRLAFGRQSWDSVAYWSARASDPASASVMWSNVAFNALVDRDEWAVIESYLPRQRGAVLDLGCGTGRVSARLASHFDEYTGVDLPSMVEEARRRNPALAERYIGAPLAEYTFPNERFDFVLSLGCLATACFVDDLETVGRAIVGSVRPGGRIVLIEPFHTNTWLTRGCKTTPRRVVDLFERLGTKNIALSGMIFPPARMLLSEKPFEALPRLTKVGYKLGERIVGLRPSLLSDYSVIVFDKA